MEDELKSEMLPSPSSSINETIITLGDSPLNLHGVGLDKRESYFLRKYQKVSDIFKRSFGEASGVEVLKLTEIDSLQEKAEYADGILNSV